MKIFEILVILLTSGILTALLALFYRFGKNQERLDNSFKAIDERFSKMDGRFNKFEENR